MRLTFKELKDEVKKIVPKDIPYTVELEAGNIALVTPEPNRILATDGLLAKLAQKVKRKIVLRPDASIMKSEEEATRLVKEIIPESAGINQIYFDACYREITVQCANPGEAVGRRGVNLQQIRDQCGWLVSVERTPPLISKTVHDIRGYRHANADERRTLLKNFGLNIHRPQRPGSTWARVTALVRTGRLEGPVTSLLQTSLE